MKKEVYFERKFKWWHGLIIFVVANAISALPAGFNGEEAFYNSFTLPNIAPPDWLFAPVWLFNNITSLIALYIIANMPKHTPNRNLFLWSEGLMWVLFAIFTSVYFGLKSPILGAIDTVLGLIATMISMKIALKLSKKASWYLLPRFLWLLLATYVSIYVAFANPDTFFISLAY